MSSTHTGASPEPCVLVIFGASGDLTHRKLVPALYELELAGQLPEGLCVLGVSRTEYSDEKWRENLTPWAKKHAREFDDASWRKFAGRIHYLSADAAQADAYPVLIKRIAELGREHGISHADQTLSESSPWAQMPNVLFYLSVSPRLVAPIVQRIGDAGLVYQGQRWCALDGSAMPWQRLIMEKPIGSDLRTADELIRAVGRVFEEESVYRIDHYLGKELVRNILVMRFANTMFEPLWNNQYVDHIQVSAAETVGVGKRAGNFYDGVGAMRDMIQSHLLQVLALVAMEPPVSHTPHGIRREKVKLLEAARPIDPDRAHDDAVLGYYTASGDETDGDGGLGYRELEGVDHDRRTETFASMCLHFDNWRWAGVPFYVRTGKKMARKLTEVVVQFKHPPAQIFRDAEPFASGGTTPANRVIINIAADEGISIRFEANVPGHSFDIKSVKADFDFKTYFDSETPESYGPLLLDALRGDQTNFMHRDEVLGTWRIIEPFIKSEQLRRRIQDYKPGSWGPAQSDDMLALDGRKWHNPAPQETR